MLAWPVWLGSIRRRLCPGGKRSLRDLAAVLLGSGGGDTRSVGFGHLRHRSILTLSDLSPRWDDTEISGVLGE